MSHTEGGERDNGEAACCTCGHDLCAQLPSHPSSQEQVKYGAPLHTWYEVSQSNGEGRVRN